MSIAEYAARHESCAATPPIATLATPRTDLRTMAGASYRDESVRHLLYFPKVLRPRPLHVRACAPPTAPCIPARACPPQRGARAERVRARAPRRADLVWDARAAEPGHCL